MKNRPIPVVIVSILFILTGSIGFVYHFKEFFEPHDKLYELIWVLVLRILAVVCGLLLFLRINWARGLAIAWLLYHIFLSAFHSTTEMITHIIILIIVVVLLYLPISTAYFKIKQTEKGRHD
jgi:uncharacterized membrane protein